MIQLEKTTKSVKYVLLSSWGLWVLLSSYLLLYSGYDDVVLYYLFYLVFSSLILVLVRRDIFSPPGIFTIAGFFSFGFNVPLIAAGMAPRIHIPDATLTKVMIVFLCADIAFMLGYVLKAHKLIPTGWVARVKRPARDSGLLLFCLLAIYVTLAALVRIHYHLGEAGMQPKIVFAGYVQYLLYDGALMLCLWYLARGLVRGRIYMMLGLTLLLGIATTQALLGWRGGIFHVFVLSIMVFWYQGGGNKGKKARSFIWLFVLIIFLSSLVELGNAVRVKRLGGDVKFTQEYLSEKIITRGQGTTRLAEVVKYFGPITLTNNFLINKLVAQRLSATQFIDRKIYGVLPDQSNSFGTSGPGGPYTAMGLLGVFACYSILGGFYRSVYNTIIDKNTGDINPVGVVFYSLIVFSLMAMLSENLNINSMKGLIAIIGQIFVYKLIIFQKFSGGKVAVQKQA